MGAVFGTPELRITYWPLVSFEIKLDKAERVANMGYVSWRCSLRCIVCHSKGQFTYEANDTFLEATALERFDLQLDAIRAGSGERAELTDDDQIAFALCLDKRRLKALIRISEFQSSDEPTLLSAGFDVDYDLFVNKLSEDLKQFIKGVKSARNSFNTEMRWLIGAGDNR
ncbi:MAG: hypothetical protein WA532_01860 [Candidatus Korobacteraceae bacterium]